MERLYPLRFKPIFRRYLWGGRRLETVLNKPIGPESDYAESWEIVDHGQDQSRVSFGPLAGHSLHDLVGQRADELLGRQRHCTQFPLLFKFLDAQRDLSVQVHPNDQQARNLNPPDLGKTEAWVILDALPGSKIYAGLKRGFDRHALEREVTRGTTALCLHSFEPRPGDCVFLPAGVVHALGAGLLVAEIQQSSDTTFRLFDWNRVGPDGKPRSLHVQAALDTIDYSLGPIDVQPAETTERPEVQRLVTCDQFILDRWQMDRSCTLEPRGRFHVLAVLEGSLRVESDPAQQSLRQGDTMLLPACLGSIVLTPQDPTVMLDIYLPD